MINYLTTSWQHQTIFPSFFYSLKTAINKEEKRVMAHQVLLIAGTIHAQWGNILQSAVGEEGSVYLATEQDFAGLLAKHAFHLVIVDAGEIGSFSQIVKEVRHLQPATKVVVATASPTWKRAREAMRAGAFDYIRKHQNEAQLARYLSQLLP